MNRDDIIRMAREAGFICLFANEAANGIGDVYDSGDEEITETLKRFAALVAAHEREKCAKVAGLWDDDVDTRLKPSEAIRARGEA